MKLTIEHVREAQEELDNYLSKKVVEDARRKGQLDVVYTIGLWIMGLGSAWMLVDLVKWFFQAD